MMNIYRMANGLTLILLSICMLLAIIIYTEIQSIGNYDNMVGGNGGKNQKVDSQTGILNNIASTDIAISQFSEVLNRPLFVQGRMPFVEEENKNIAIPTLSPLRLSLEGVVLSPTTQVAVLKDLSSNELIRLGIGMSHKGWQLKGIEPQSVEFERNGEVQSIVLERATESPERNKKPAFKLPVNRRNLPVPKTR